MKIFVSFFFVVLLALAVVSVPASHHKKNRGNVKTEERPSVANDDHPVKTGEVHWPDVEVSRIHNFPVPEAFRHGRTNNSHASEPSSGKQHGRSNHRSRSK